MKNWLLKMLKIAFQSFRFYHFLGCLPPNPLVIRAFGLFIFCLVYDKSRAAALKVQPKVMQIVE